MVIVTNVSFPTESAKEMGERFLKVSPLPDFLSRKGPFFSSNNTGVLTVCQFLNLITTNLLKG